MRRLARQQRQQVHHGVPAAYNRVVRLWILRLLVHLGAMKNIAAELHCMGSEVLQSVGIKIRFEKTHDLNLIRLRDQLKARLEREEANLPSLPVTTPLARNLAWLGETMGLSQAEQDILHLVTVQTYHVELNKTLESMGGLSLSATRSRCSRWSSAFPSPRSARPWEPSARLLRAGLVDIDYRSTFNFPNKVDLIPGFADGFGVAQRDPFKLFLSHFRSAPEGRLDPGDFPHLRPDLEILEPYLAEALQARRKGINVLIYGPPGSGKTELVRMLGRQLGARLYEISAENAKGEALEGQTRFKAYRLSQCILAGRPNHLILFDEIEDVFQSEPDPFGRVKGNTSGHKAWVNRILEENPVPAFWITNHIDSLDRAFLRRFDLALKIDIPPAQRPPQGARGLCGRPAGRSGAWPQCPSMTIWPLPWSSAPPRW